ncbi:BLUF domain-containing protein [Altererythrobacter sp. MF3-039]|uniref:BLUF domain-containing protein n=1 Tax=Altererythrobacter sp. MF3-039 TaxID=3252901 RepID=UPI00390CD8B9
MLREIVYISTAKDMDLSAVEEILESSQRSNRQRNVTGLLLYNGRNFLQLLEGDVEDLSEVMQRIENDPRHTGFSVLEDITISERACPDWSMRHIRLAADAPERRTALDAELPRQLDPNLRRIFLNFAALN